MTTTEPGWVEENQLADRLGWVCLKDESRSKDPRCHWGLFKKWGDCIVWKDPTRTLGWVRSTLIGGVYTNHVEYSTLERALRGEKV